MISAVYWLLLRNQLTRGRLLALGALGLLAVFIGFALGISDQSDFDRLEAAVDFVNGYGLSLLTPVVALVFASASLGEPAEDGTLVYLWLRPVPRGQLVLAALMATLSVTIPLTVVPLVLAAALGGQDTSLVVGTALASLVAAPAYAGLFVWLGLRVRRALLWGLGYLLLWEGFVANSGDTAARLAVLSYSRSVLAEVADVDLRLADVHFGPAVAVPLLATIAMAALATRRLARMDVA